MLNGITLNHDKKVYNLNTNNNSPSHKQTPSIVTNNNADTKLDSKLLQSYFVSFGAKAKTKNPATNGEFLRLQKKFTPTSQKIWDRAVSVAEKNQHSEVTYVHLFKAMLEYVDKYIDDLNSGRKTYSKNGDEFVIKEALESTIDNEIFKDRNKRDKFTD